MTLPECDYPAAHHDGVCIALAHSEHVVACPMSNSADYVCTGGSSATRCMNPVSADDPDNELCCECMQVEILKLEESLDDVMTRLLRYRRAVT